MAQAYEYHVVGVVSIAGKFFGSSGIQTECDKRAAEGYRLVAAYPEPKGKRHVLIFERPAVSALAPSP